MDRREVTSLAFRFRPGRYGLTGSKFALYALAQRAWLGRARLGWCVTAGGHKGRPSMGLKPRKKCHQNLGTL